MRSFAMGSTVPPSNGRVRTRKKKRSPGVPRVHADLLAGWLAELW